MSAVREQYLAPGDSGGIRACPRNRTCHTGVADSGLPRWKTRLLILLPCFLPAAVVAESYTLFESAPVRTLALSADGQRLFVANTPDNHLEIYTFGSNSMQHTASVPVGMEPVAVAIRGSDEVWVVNHLSDSVSIVDVAATPPRTVATLQVGDEPRDIVFAGPGRNRAFITTAHRGQHSPYTDPANPGELTTPGIGRADVWVFEADDAGQDAGGVPLTIVTLFGDTPRALATSPDGVIVYAAVFQSGNQSTVIHGRAVCSGGESAEPCAPTPGELLAPGGLPTPNTNVEGIEQPRVGLIVKHRDGEWQDELGRDWSSMVRFNLPDQDLFAIDAMTDPPHELASLGQIGTALFNIAVNPVSGKLYVSNTEANNGVRFEGEWPSGNVRGHLHEARVTVIDKVGGVFSRHLNKHIDYSQVPSPPGTREKSLATPMGMAVTSDGKTLYLAAFGSAKLAVFDTAQLENDSFQPDSSTHISLSGGGPGALVLDEQRRRIYVTTRFDNGLSVIDMDSHMEVAHLLMPNPEPPSITQGRRFLYDAVATSSNGEASCASCHLFGDTDGLSWDLGDPLGLVRSNPNPGIGPEPANSFHPLKGPMSTQSLRGLSNHGPMHWRGDRTAAESGSDPMDELGAFKTFNVAFSSLLGREGPLADADMQAFAEFALHISYPPNPIRALDNSLTPLQHTGRDFFFGELAAELSGLTFTCNTCHELDHGLGFFGSNGLTSFIRAPQDMKTPHLRNLYQKVGLFGMPDIENLTQDENTHMGDQIRGFGFFHDGSIDTLDRFHSDVIFSDGTHARRRELEQFMFAFDSNLAPVVGQQWTLHSGNAALIGPQIDLLTLRAAQGECDLVVKGVVGDLERGAWRIADGANVGMFQSDKASEPLLAEAEIRGAGLLAGNVLTYTCVPPGSGERMGIDRDLDGTFNFDDNCAWSANPDQADQDGDGKGDVCDPPNMPVPLVTANGSTSPIVITQGDNLNVAISGTAGDFAGRAVDWWITADTPLGLHWWVAGQGWIQSDLPLRSYDGEVLTFGPLVLTDENNLPAGQYAFRFAQDDNLDGILDATFFATVHITIATN